MLCISTNSTKAILDFEACLFLRLPKLGRKVMIGMLAGSEVMDFEKACTNKECKKALLEAYEGTEVFGFEFPYELPKYRVDRNYENPEELECAGLEWTEKRGIIAREFTLKLPDGGDYSDKNRHLPELISRKRRAMARLIITRCFKSYDINAQWWCWIYSSYCRSLDMVRKKCSGCCARELMCSTFYSFFSTLVEKDSRVPIISSC